MGVEIEIIQEGDGEYPTKGSYVTVHYTGSLVDGTVFDTSRNKPKPFTFELGAGRVIKGWEEGIAKMSTGEISKLTITPDFGYGSKSVPGIPPNSTLIFEKCLLDASNIDFFLLCKLCCLSSDVIPNLSENFSIGSVR
eukprot:gene11594-14198_t